MCSALQKKRVAASASRVGLKRNSRVSPSEIHCTIEVHPRFLDLDGGFVHFPRVIAGCEMWPTALLQFGCAALHPAVDRGVIDVQPALEHHFFQITIAERIAHVPAYTQKNDIGLEMTPCERGLLAHDGELLCSAPNKEECIALSSFVCNRRVYLLS